MNLSNSSQNEFQILKGCTPTLIKNVWLGLLIFAGCIIPPILGYVVSGPSHIMPNSQAAIFLIPMSVSFILLPFTGIIRKIIYAVPLLTMLIIFWPLALFGIVEKVKDSQFDVKNVGFFSLILWIVDIIVGWFLVGIGALILVMTVLTINQ